jgi:hypothetical protein
MRKHWYVFIILALLVFQAVVVIQPFAYATQGDSCNHGNGKIVSSGGKAIFCVPEEKVKEINQKLTKVAEDSSFVTDYLIINSKDKTLDLPYRILGSSDNQIMTNQGWKSIESLVDSNNNKSEIIKTDGLIKIKQDTPASTDPNCMSILIDSASVLSAIVLLFIFIAWSGQKNWLIKDKDCWTLGLMILLFIVSCGGFQFFSNSFNIKDYIGFVFPICLGIVGGFYSSLQSIKTAKIEKALQYIDKWDSSEVQTHRSNLLLSTFNFLQSPTGTTVDPNSTGNSTRMTKKNLIDEIKELRLGEINGIIVTPEEIGELEEENNKKKYPSTEEKEQELENKKTALKKENLEKKTVGKDDRRIQSMKIAISKNSKIKINLRIICNFWEKLYIVLEYQLAEKSILKETFYGLYQDRYIDVCLSFLQYLALEENEETSEMQKHLRQLGSEPIWG